MERNRAHGKLNNAGLSLVELLVAMTIIAIVSTAFYNGFVLAAKTNSKAKIQHKATSLAQNILEGLKAEDMDSVLQQFAWPTTTTAAADGSTSGQTNFRILNTSIMGSESTYTSDKLGIFLLSTAETGSSDPVTLSDYVTSDDNGVTAKYTLRDDGTYCLYLRDIKMESTSFDALITMDGSAYMENEATNSSESGQDYNSKEIIRIPTVNHNYDAVIGNGVDYETNALTDLITKTSNSSLTRNDLYYTVTVTITNNDIVGVSSPRQTVTAEYVWKTASGATHTETDVVYDNTNEEDTRQLRNIYLYYAPNFDAGSNLRDQIVINNNKGSSKGAYEAQLYLIKQQTSNEESLLQTDESNTSYRLGVKVQDDASSTIDGVESALQICTNFGYSFRSGSVITGNTLQAVYSHNGTALTDDQASAYYQINTLTNSRRTDLIFDVTVEVFLHDSDNDAVDIDITDVDNFRDKIAGDLKATMTGTLRN